MSKMKRVILDVGADIEDSLAILYAVKYKGIKLEGITTIYGDSDAEKFCKNVLKNLGLSETENFIPVVKGAVAPLKYRVAEYSPYSKEEATNFIIKKVKAYPGEITLVSVGGLTNIALALMKDPSIAKEVERVIIRGGALEIPGDATAVSETIVHRDPEAAHKVFESGVPITMVGLDAIRNIKNQEDYVTKLLEKLTLDRKQLAVQGENRKGLGEKGFPLHALLASAMVDDSSYTRTEEFYVYVETKGTTSLGATLVDLRYPQRQTNATVCKSVDEKKFIDHVVAVLTHTVK